VAVFGIVHSKIVTSDTNGETERPGFNRQELIIIFTIQLLNVYM